jgi:hypothetical protein
LHVLFLICLLFAPAGIHAQRERQMQAPEEDAYGSKFFDQLRGIFGKFREDDLQRVFQTAEPIQCSELVVGKGQWKTVAFFNEDRSLGDWCRNNLQEVKSDLAAYNFKGPCTGDRQTIQVTTEFPVSASVDAYNEAKITWDQIDINVNEPVSVAFDPRTQAYTFELPYLFLVGHRSAGNVYSLIAPNVGDGYAADVTNRWECKAVKSKDVTYRFLICRTAMVGRNASPRSQNRDLPFGASAFFILSDGKEAQTSVNLSYSAEAHPAENPRESAPPTISHERPAVTSPETVWVPKSWQIPDVRSKVVEFEKENFRLRFSPQTWTGKIDAPEILYDQKLSTLLSARLQQGADYCSWRPDTANSLNLLLASEPDADVSYSMEVFNKDKGTATSIVFDMNTNAGVHLGTLRCVFPRAESAANIALERWISIVGGHLTLEVRR